MVIQAKPRFKSKLLPKQLKDTYHQLHILEFKACDLLVKDPIKGFDEKNEGFTDMKMFQRKITELIDEGNTDMHTMPYGFNGESTLIDFRGCYEQSSFTLDTAKHYPDMPAAIAGALAYAASLRFTAIAITDDEGDEDDPKLEEMDPGIMPFIKAAMKEHKVHEEMWLEVKTK